MSYRPNVFLSNNPTTLLGKLDSDLFKMSDPFAKKWVVVPNTEVGSWIQNGIGFSHTHGIAMGFSTIASIERLLHQLNSLLLPYNSLKIPDDASLFSTIKKNLNPDIRSIRRKGYNFIKKFFLTEDTQLSFETVNSLAHLFKKFYFQKFDIDQFDNETKLTLLEIQNFFPQLEEVFQTLQNEIQKQSQLFNLKSLHFFLFSDFSLPCLNFLTALHPNIAVTFYQLSPCEEFWYDHYSDMELTHIVESLPYEDPDSHISTYPLLNNLGIASRKLFSYFQDHDFQFEESYSNIKRLNQLNEFQNNLLSLSPTNMIEDDSVSVFTAPSPVREVEIVCDKILEIIRKNNLNNFSDIFVSVTDANLYFPLIEQIFWEQIPFKISGQVNCAGKTLKEKSELLFSLIQSDMGMEHMLLVLSHPDFLKKRSWKTELPSITNLLRKSDILWNYDLEGHPDYWMSWIKKIFHDLPFLRMEQNDDIFLSQAQEIYGELACFIYEVTEFSKFSKQRHYSHQYKEYFKKLISFCFILTEKEEEVLHQLNSIFFHPDRTMEIDFTFFRSYFLYAINKNFSYFPSHIGNFIRIGLLTHLECLPKDYSFILGFPNINRSTNPLDTCNQSSLKAEQETKSAILQNFITTKKEIHLSCSFEGQDEENLSLIFQEILKISPAEKIERHPIQNYHPLYFSKDSYIFSHNSHRFLMSQSFLSPRIFQKDFFSLHNSFLQHKTNYLPKDLQVISITDLVNCLKYPLNHFLKNKYKINLRLPESPFLTPLFYPQKSFKKKIKKHYLNQILCPSSPCLSTSFRQFFTEANEDEILSLERFFNRSNFDYNTITLSATTLNNSSFCPEKTLTLSPLIVNTDYAQIQIVGTISGISSEGCYYQGSYNSNSGLPIQEYLEIILLYALNIIPSYQGKIFFIDPPNPERSIRPIETIEESEDKLQKILKYYFLSMHYPSPLIPDLIPGILEKNEEKLQKLIKDFIDGLMGGTPEFWIMNFRKDPPAEKIIKHWRDIGLELGVFRYEL